MMKFTDGNWLIREGYNVLSATQAHDFDQEDGKVTAYVSPRPIVTRSNMLDTMLLTVKFHSPLPGVIGVKLVHHEGVVERGVHVDDMSWGWFGATPWISVGSSRIPSVRVLVFSLISFLLF